MPESTPRSSRRWFEDLASGRAESIAQIAQAEGVSARYVGHLIPLAFLQIFLNGLVLVYDWPDIFLLLTSGAGLALAWYIIYRAVRVEPRGVRLVPAHVGRPASTAAPAGAEASDPA